MCEAQCGARIILEAAEFWPGGPDKVLGVSESWAAREQAAMQAMLRALLRASVWADAPENAGELASLLATPDYLSAPPGLIAKRLGEALHRVVIEIRRWRGQLGADLRQTDHAASRPA